MHKESAESVQNAAQVIERSAQVDVRNVDMPVLMGLQRLPTNALAATCLLGRGLCSVGKDAV